jgi:hypothetical protein
MDLPEFSQISHAFWTGWFGHLQWLFDRDQFRIDGVVLFPTMMICTRTDSHFAVELAGASRRFNGLVLKQRTQQSINEYFAQFPDEETESILFVHNRAGGSTFSRICIANEVDFSVAEKRFPSMRRYGSKLVSSNTTPFHFGPNFSGSLVLNDCLLLNARADIYRAKHFFDLLVVSNQIPESQLRLVLSDRVIATRHPEGTITVESEGEAERYLVASQLQSLYLTPHLHETTIGEFFTIHPDILARALGALRLVPEPHLNWVDGADENEDGAINPDLLFLRSDGFYDILDFKTALLANRNTTRGPRRRRAFISTINEGIAQLAHYAEYFTLPKNSQLALEKYGVQVKEPNLYLIVGNYDNTTLTEVQEAKRPFGRNLTVLDYDSLVQLYLGGESG